MWQQFTSTSKWALLAGHTHFTMSPECPTCPSFFLLYLLGSQAMTFSSSSLLSPSGFLVLSTSQPPPWSLSIPHVCHYHCLLPFFLFSFFFFEFRDTGSGKSYACSWNFLIKDLFMAFLYLLFSLLLSYFE